AEQLAIRILSERTRIESDRIRKAEISNKDFLKFTQESRKLMELPFFIDDTPALTISTLRTRARRLKREKGLHLIVVDYLQLLRSDRRGSVDNRVLELGEITRGLKTLAKELDVPVLALSQLSRALEQREDKRPQLSDLRESGSIEQDADVVMFVYREEYYHKREEEAARDKGGDSWTRWMEKAERCHNVAELIIGKQRHGPTGTIKLHFDSAFTRFSDLDTYHGG
ncbi:MAG: DnaB-like helicase C-terminal domain-containing protein, partial [Pseudomonadota bacterium]|nr:DnaB-like helicase C-terminal domain-containing protein [Pseudomonadota bacterium]